MKSGIRNFEFSYILERCGNILPSINHSFLKSARYIAALKTNVSEFFSTSFFSARNISMAEEKLLLLVITYARPRLFFSTLKVHDPMVTNCYYTFFSTYNLVTTSVYFASTCSLRSNSRDSSLIFYSWKIGASFTYAQHEFVAFLWTP